LNRLCEVLMNANRVFCINQIYVFTLQICTCSPLKILKMYTLLLLGYSYAIRHSFLRKMSCLRLKNEVILIEPKGRFHYSTNRSRGLKKD